MSSLSVDCTSGCSLSVYSTKLKQKQNLHVKRRTIMGLYVHIYD